MVAAARTHFRPLMPVMVALFAAMNALFISAIALGTSANAILLQNTAPFFVYLVVRVPARRAGRTGGACGPAWSAWPGWW